MEHTTQYKKVIMISLCALIVGIVIGNAFGHAEKQLEKPEDTMHHMESAMDTMSAGLTGKTGDEFDRAFITDMITHHEGAVAMAELALTHAKHQEIKTLATAIISAQTAEITQMKNWLKSWYNQ